MDSVATGDLVLVTLGEDSGPEGGVSLSAVADTISGSGQQLSRQVEIAVAVERLVDRGLVTRETVGDTERLRLTEDGESRAADAADRLTDRRIEVVEGEARRELTVGEAAATLDRSPVSVASECSEDGVYYHQDRVEGDDIVGREQERAQFEELLGTVRRTGAGEAVRLVGPGGNGKTALGDAMLAATPDSVETVRAGASEADTEPYQPVRDALADLGVADRLDPTGFEADDFESYEAQQTGLFTEITDLLTPDSGVRVLFFDDVNQADPATWSYLAFLCERLADRPLVVVMAHRPGTLPEDAPIHSAGDAGTTWIEVTGLSRDATGRLIEHLVGRRGVPEEFLDAVYERTGGTPLYVETTVETLLETDQLDPEFRWYPTDPQEFDLPDAVHETIQRQAAALEPDVRDLLEWVAVASGFVSVPLLSQVADAPPERIATIVETAGSMGLVQRSSRDGDLHVSFRNDVFADALAGSLPGSESRRRHSAIAAHLEPETGQESPEGEGNADLAATVAYHYERGGDTAAAVEWYREAADRATDVYAHETAIDHYYRAIDVAREAGDTGTVLAVNERLAELYTTVGSYDEAEKHVQYVRERARESDTIRSQRVACREARIHNARGEYEEAIETARAALDGDTRPTGERCRLLGVLADAYDGQGDLERAAETAERQRGLAASLEDPPLEADAVRRLGLVATKQGDQDRAQERLVQSRDVFRTVGDRGGEADCLHGLGETAHLSGQYEQAREYYEQARDVSSEIGDRRGHARSLAGIGKASAMLGEYDRAERASQQGLTVFRTIGDREGEADCLNGLGVVAFRRRDYGQTRQHHEAALAIRREIGDREGEAALLNNLGNAATLQGEYDAALGYFEQALPALREIGHRHGESMCLRNLGNIAAARGDYGRAREYYDESLDIARETDSRRLEAMCLHDTGTVERIHGAYEAAGEHYDQALAIRREIGERHGEAETLHDLGTLARQRGNADGAVDSYGESRDVAAELGDPSREALALCGLCALDRRAGTLDAAEDRIEAALALVNDEANPSEVSRVQLEAGRVALARCDVATAGDRADRARETFEKLDEPLGIGRSRRLLGRIAAAEGDIAAAIEHWRAALELFESLGATPDALRTLEALADACLERGDDEQASEYCDRARTVCAEAPASAGEVHGQWIEELSPTPRES